MGCDMGHCRGSSPAAYPAVHAEQSPVCFPGWPSVQL